MSRVMFSLPDKLVVRIKSVIPDGERSRLVAEFLEKEVAAREAQFFNAALQLETNEDLRKEMQDWDALIDDGLENV